jgi:hypothetical protein
MLFTGVIIWLSLCLHVRGQQTISMTAYESSTCSGSGLSACFDLTTCTYTKNEDGMSVYLQVQDDPFMVNIYVDPWCAWSVGTISPNTDDGACGPGSCCSGAVEVFGSDETPSSGFFFKYDQTTCTPEIPSDDPYLSDDTDASSIGSVISQSVRRQFTTVLRGEKKQKSTFGMHSNSYFTICSMFATGVLVGGLVSRFLLKPKPPAYDRIPDETTGIAMCPQNPIDI